MTSFSTSVNPATWAFNSCGRPWGRLCLGGEVDFRRSVARLPFSSTYPYLNLQSRYRQESLSSLRLCAAQTSEQMQVRRILV